MSTQPASPRFMRLAALLLAGLGCATLLPAATYGGEIYYYQASKLASYTQNSAAQPAAADAWTFAGLLYYTPDEVSTASITFDAPAPMTVDMGQSGSTLHLYYSDAYVDSADLDLAYPSTTYTFTLDRGAGPESADVFLPDNLYAPDVPFMTGDTFDRLQVIDVTQPFDLYVNGFVPPADVNLAQTNIQIAETGVALVYSVSVDPSVMQVQIPAGLLNPGTLYNFTVQYYCSVETPDAGFDTATSGATFIRDTNGFFTTLPAPVVCTPTWAQANPAGPLPSPRVGGNLVYDAARDRIVMFGGSFSPGGVGNQCNAETWEWDGLAWTLRAVGGPSARSLAPMAYDSARARTVMVGGWCGTSVRDTWEWDGNTWSLRSISGPSLRHFAAVAYDAARGKTVLFGGYQPTPAQWMNDTWEWDGATWTQIPVAGPPARYSHQMAYDAARQRVVMFGGANASTIFGDTWEFDGVAWTQVSTGALADPGPRVGHVMAYDDARGRVLLYGGIQNNPTAYFDGTWEFDGVAWTLLAAGSPPARGNSGMTYDSARAQMVLFGGYEPPPAREQNDTWLLAPMTTSITQQPRPASACRTGVASFSLTMDGVGAFTYLWQLETDPGVWQDLTSDAAALPCGGDAYAIPGNSPVVQIGVNPCPGVNIYKVRCVVTNTCGSATSDEATLTINTADFNGDGDTGTDSDISAFFACLSGNCCATCGSADFNGDGDTGTDADIESFFRVLAGGPC